MASIDVYRKIYRSSAPNRRTPDHGGRSIDQPIAAFLVFLAGEDVEDLREILDVDRAGLAAVKPPDGKGLALQFADAFGKALDVGDINKLHGRHGHAEPACERHHREFVFG